ncbi:MAG: hypothetical protein WC003_01210 [Terrimicrobiaceae bacterium]
MIFRRAEPNREYRALRFLSDGKRWELGLSPYQSGVRLRMGLAGRPPSVIDFCLGHNPGIYSPVLLAVIERLERVPESASSREVDAAFPWSGTRPDLNVHLEALVGKTC